MLMRLSALAFAAALSVGPMTGTGQAAAAQARFVPHAATAADDVSTVQYEPGHRRMRHGGHHGGHWKGHRWHGHHGHHGHRWARHHRRHLGHYGAFLPIYPFIGSGAYYSYYDPGPVYVAPRRYSYYRADISSAHYEWCYARYRSYRASDNTFQPYYGPRRQCISPYQ